MRKFAILGGWHVHAEGYGSALNRLKECEVVKVWDNDPERAKTLSEALGCKTDTLEGILSDPAVWGVVVTAATNEHPNILIQAAKSGKAIFTEKVLTLKAEDAEKVQAALAENNTRFGISFPHLCKNTIQYALSCIQDGSLGTLNYARVRNVHGGVIENWLPPHFFDPVATGGGAMIDLGAHPMYLLCAFLGMPLEVRSLFTHVADKPVEDNAVSLLSFENGAIGVSETGFVSCAFPYQVELGGDKGTLLIEGDTLRLATRSTGGTWTEPALPPSLPDPIEIWAVSQKNEDIPAFMNAEAAVRLTRVMEMAYKNIK